MIAASRFVSNGIIFILYIQVLYIVFRGLVPIDYHILGILHIQSPRLKCCRLHSGGVVKLSGGAFIHT